MKSKTFEDQDWVVKTLKIFSLIEQIKGGTSDYVEYGHDVLRDAKGIAKEQRTAKLLYQDAVT